jgi:hypothetical protein
LIKPTATTALEAAEESVLAATATMTSSGAPTADPEPGIPQAEAEAAPVGADDEAGPVGSFVPAPEPSPLHREILGAAEDMAGDWQAEPRPLPGASTSTPLEMLDETEMVADGPTLHTDRKETAAPVATGMPDEEFLRRVVLPPLPQQHSSGAMPRTFLVTEDSGDKTVISDPPTPEMLAGFRSAGRATAAIKQRLTMPVELTTIELFGLLTGSAIIGGIIGALFLSMPQGSSAGRPVPAAAAVANPAPPPPVPTAPAALVEEPLPVPRPTIEPLPPPAERVAPEDPSIAARSATTSKRTRRPAARKPPKKEWVDPFEQ